MCQKLNDTLNFANKAYGKFQMIYIARRHIVGGGQQFATQHESTNLSKTRKKNAHFQKSKFGVYTCACAMCIYRTTQ